MWRAYISERLADGVNRGSGEKICARLTDLWAFDQLSARPAGITRPPWEEEGVDDYLPSADGSRAENSMEPLDLKVLGPLLVWAIRFVDDFADHILASWEARERLLAYAALGPLDPAHQEARVTRLQALCLAWSKG